MKRICLLLVWLCWLSNSSFAQKHHVFIDSTINVDEDNVPVERGQFYFPEELFPKVEMIWHVKGKTGVVITPKVHKTETDTLALSWYSQFLFALKEPLLFNKPLNKTVYRFTWLRSFHKPVVVRIEKAQDDVFLYWKVAEKTNGLVPGGVEVSEKRRLTVVEWDEFIQKVKLTSFWKLERYGSYGEDGSEWILEGAEPSRYHVVSAWSPKKRHIYEPCKYLLELTDLDLKKAEKY